MGLRRLGREYLPVLFCYRKPTKEEEQALIELGARFAEKAEEIWDLMPEGPGRTIAIRNLQAAHESAKTAIMNRGEF